MCEVIEIYPEDRPFPTGLILGFTEAGRPIHTVVAVSDEEDMLWLITVYEPTLTEWREGFRVRRMEDDMPTV